jgi:hypothetical protein
MAHHWEWALRYAMQHYDADHFTFVSSRWIVRQGGLARALEQLSLNVEAILTYDDAVVMDEPGLPIRVARKQLSGRLVCVNAAHLLYLVSQALFPNCLPRMLNCILPRSVIDRVTERFGDLFGSVAPDHCCAYRCLSVVEQFHHFDEAVLVQYGQRLSTGTGMFARQPNEAYADFKANLNSASPTWAAPVPDIELNINVVFHEYCLARIQSGSPKLPELDRERYFEAIANELTILQDEERKKQIVEIMRVNGWRGPVPAALPPDAPTPDDARVIVPLWTRFQALFGRRPPEDDARIIFRSLEDALWFSSRFSKAHSSDAPHLGILDPAWRLSA